MRKRRWAKLCTILLIVEILLPGATLAGGPEANSSQSSTPEPLPAPPMDLPDESSPFSPHWFKGPGQATLIFKQGKAMNGKVTLDKSKVLFSDGRVDFTFDVSAIDRIVWSGSCDYGLADEYMGAGLYDRASLLYTDSLMEKINSQIAAGANRQNSTIPGRWYLDGRILECQAKLAHIEYAAVIFSNTESAQPAQLEAAKRNFLQAMSHAYVTSPGAEAFRDAMQSGKIKLSDVEQTRWNLLNSKTIEPVVKVATAAQPKSIESSKPVSVPTSTKPSSSTVSLTNIPVSSSANTKGPVLTPIGTLSPTLVSLSYVGGVGDQWIQEVGFSPNGIYGKSSGFTVMYDTTGSKFLGISGNLEIPSTGLRGALWSNKSGSNAVSNGISLNLKMKQVHTILQQPCLTSSAGWKWWDWTHDQVTHNSGPYAPQMADSRGVNVLALPGGKFLTKCWADGGNTVLQCDPRDINKPNSYLTRAVDKSFSGARCLYMIGDASTGEPLCGTVFGFRPEAECVDGDGRIYVAMGWDRGKKTKDTFGLGGQGFSILSPDLSEVQFFGSLGVSRPLCIAVHGNMCVVGGLVEDKDAEKLKILNPSQPKPGGGTDGFIAIIKLK